MKKVCILCAGHGKINRGVESWASEISRRIPGIQIVSGDASFNPLKWPASDIYVPTNGRLQVVMCRLWTWLKGKKMIVFGHSGPGADDKWNLLCLPEIFVGFSDYQVNWARKYCYFKTSVTKIPHAIDTEVFHPSKHVSKGFNVLCVAANSPAKRVELVKKAVDLIPEARLRIVGFNQPESLSYSQMPQVYQDSSLFCFVPKSYEAYGLVFLEALASNLPVVTSDDPVRREIVGNAGLYTQNPQNAQELASLIVQSHNKKWGVKPLQQAKKFSWSSILPLYIKLFHE